MRTSTKFMAVGLLSLGASATQAAIVANPSATNVFTSTVAGAVTINFETNQATCGGYASCTPSAPGTSFLIVNNSVGGQFAQPYLTNSYYLTVANPLLSGSATFNLGTAADYFGLYWGSIDTYNTLTFIRNGVDVQSFTGSQLAPLLATGGQADWSSNRYINFWAQTSADQFDSIRITSSGFAFESDNHAYRPVPLPAAAWLLISGLAGMGIFGRRRTAA